MENQKLCFTGLSTKKLEKNAKAFISLYEKSSFKITNIPKTSFQGEIETNPPNFKIWHIKKRNKLTSSTINTVTSDNCTSLLDAITTKRDKKRQVTCALFSEIKCLNKRRDAKIKLLNGLHDELRKIQRQLKATNTIDTEEQCPEDDTILTHHDGEEDNISILLETSESEESSTDKYTPINVNQIRCQVLQNLQCFSPEDSKHTLCQLIISIISEISFDEQNSSAISSLTEALSLQKLNSEELSKSKSFQKLKKNYAVESELPNQSKLTNQSKLKWMTDTVRKITPSNRGSIKNLDFTSDEPQSLASDASTSQEWYFNSANCADIDNLALHDSATNPTENFKKICKLKEILKKTKSPRKEISQHLNLNRQDMLASWIHDDLVNEYELPVSVILQLTCEASNAKESTDTFDDDIALLTALYKMKKGLIENNIANSHENFKIKIGSQMVTPYIKLPRSNSKSPHIDWLGAQIDALLIKVILRHIPAINKSNTTFNLLTKTSQENDRSVRVNKEMKNILLNLQEYTEINIKNEIIKATRTFPIVFSSSL